MPPVSRVVTEAWSSAALALGAREGESNPNGRGLPHLELPNILDRCFLHTLTTRRPRCRIAVSPGLATLLAGPDVLERKDNGPFFHHPRTSLVRRFRSGHCGVCCHAGGDLSDRRGDGEADRR